MTEQSETPHRKNPAPRKTIIYEVLVLCVLLLAVIVVYALIFQRDIFPASISPVTPTVTGRSSTEITASETPLDEVPSMESTLTETPLVELPISTETPASTTTFSPSLTPAFGSCQYTLRSGPVDYLYAIYWNWHINKNIASVQDYYARITCAALLSNIKCDYQAAKPNITKPGWILILPGVSANICLHYGGKPLP